MSFGLYIQMSGYKLGIQSCKRIIRNPDRPIMYKSKIEVHYDGDIRVVPKHIRIS